MKFELTPVKVLAIIIVPILLAAVIRFVIMDNGDKTKGQTVQGIQTDWPDELEIKTTWLLPEVLLEVSGIDWLDAERFLCVQDEKGKIFVYNIRLNTIEKEISFGPKGDYEGIAIVDSSVYVLDAAGLIYEIGNFQTGTPLVKSYPTTLKKKMDCESLTYDRANKRLLVAVKADSPGMKAKPIYAFDLASKKILPKPAYQINLADPIFSAETDEKKKGIRPSDIAIHPSTGDLYILEGTHPQLLIMSQTGQMKGLINLKKSVFPQPEGLCFDSKGELFISNEGDKDEGNILQVQLNEPL